MSWCPMQAAWRGAWQRRQAGPRFWDLRRRLRLAALEGARNPQKRLGARTLAAVGDLLNAHHLAEVRALGTFHSRLVYSAAAHAHLTSVRPPLPRRIAHESVHGLICPSGYFAVSPSARQHCNQLRKLRKIRVPLTSFPSPQPAWGFWGQQVYRKLSNQG